MCNYEKKTLAILFAIAVLLSIALAFYYLHPCDKHDNCVLSTQEPNKSEVSYVHIEKREQWPHRGFSHVANSSKVEAQLAKTHSGFLRSRLSGNEPANVSQLASDKNQVMDELLNQLQMPSDYGETMMKLYRDKKQDVLTRDFAVQHIGLYAQALNRRGEYDAASAESQKLRLALFDVCRFVIG